MIPEVGQSFGPYEILGRLGRGGMGLVFRAWDDRLHREVALKLLHDDYKMPGMRERFLLEARAASALNHPNICTIFDIGEQNGNPYLVMELLQGETLRDRITRGVLLPEEIVRYAQEIAEALSAAHAKGIVHRDIKPANIFLVSMANGRRQAKVLDFGLAKIGLSAGGGWGSRTLDLTLTGSTVGTLAYMSPEQGRGESLDGRSDLFSLGIVMYEMATRQAPFKGTTSAQMFVQLFNHNPEPVRNWNEAVPRDLEKIIQKLLVKDRRERFQTAKEVQEALGKIAVRRSRGGWLNRGAPPAVPLVRPTEPVARPKPPVRPTAVQQAAAQRAAVQPAVDNGFIPKRESNPSPLPHHPPPASPAPSPENKWTALARAALRPMWQGGVALSDSSSAHMPVAKTLNAGAEQEQREAQHEVDHWPAPSLSEPGVAQLPYGLDDLDAYGFIAQDPAEDLDLERQHERRLRERKLMELTVALAALILIVGVIAVLARNGSFRPLVLGPGDALLLTVVQNRTGDPALDNTVMQGLEFELEQSDRFKLFGDETYRAGLRAIKAGAPSANVPAQKVAQEVGAKAYLFGEIKGAHAPYYISVDLLNARTNDELASLRETAKSREEIPATISKLAQEVQAEIGGSGWRRARKSIALGDEATSNVDALHAYAQGEAASERGELHEALADYQHAISLDPRFTQAQIQLAWLARAQGAELAAANAARVAQASSLHASEKTKLLAQLSYQVNVDRDYNSARKTIQKYVALSSRDAEGLSLLAQASRLSGYFPEALLAAQQGYGENPYHAAAYSEAELALIDLDRYDDALQLEAQAQRAGIASGENILATAFLAGKPGMVAKQAPTLLPAHPEQAANLPLLSYGLYLDNTGQIATGTAFWNAAASTLATVPPLTSAPATLLAQSALDRALSEHCGEALTLAAQVERLDRGPLASFHAGAAAALCGDKPFADREASELQQRFPQNVAVTQHYLPELKAANFIGINEPSKALDLLLTIADNDQASLAPYLRGMAHAAVGQFPVAVVDFQNVLSHRGLDFAMGNIYPMAEIGLARAAAANHDKANSTAAYQKFLTLWPNADKNEPLIKEALAKTK